MQIHRRPTCSFRLGSSCSKPPRRSLVSVPLVSTTSDRDVPASCAARRTRLVFPLAVGPTRMGIHPLSMQCSTDSSRPCWEASSCSCSLCGRGAAVLPAHQQGPTVDTTWQR